jgi:uncharacterized membrane protein
MSRSRQHRRTTFAALGGAVLMLALSSAGAAAHSHVVNQGTDLEHVIANGQNHPAFDPATFTSCDTNTLLPGYGPAWYGLETAHHGPDSGTAGKGDGCYQADASPTGEADDVNPAID